MRCGSTSSQNQVAACANPSRLLQKSTSGTILCIPRRRRPRCLFQWFPRNTRVFANGFHPNNVHRIHILRSILTRTCHYLAVALKRSHSGETRPNGLRLGDPQTARHPLYFDLHVDGRGAANVASENLSLRERRRYIYPTTRRLLHQVRHRIVRRSSCVRCHCASLSKGYPQCEEEGLKCNHSSSDFHIAVEDGRRVLGVESLSPHPSGNYTHNQSLNKCNMTCCVQMHQTVPNCCPNAPNTSELW